MCQRFLSSLGLYDHHGETVREHVVHLARDPGSFRSRSGLGGVYGALSQFDHQLLPCPQVGAEQPCSDQREVPAKPVEHCLRGRVLRVERLTDRGQHRHHAERREGYATRTVARHGIAQHEGGEQRPVAFRRADPHRLGGQGADRNREGRARPNPPQYDGARGHQVAGRDSPSRTYHVRAEQLGRQHIQQSGQRHGSREGNVAAVDPVAPSCENGRPPACRLGSFCRASGFIIEDELVPSHR